MKNNMAVTSAPSLSILPNCPSSFSKQSLTSIPSFPSSRFLRVHHHQQFSDRFSSTSAYRFTTRGGFIDEEEEEEEEEVVDRKSRFEEAVDLFNNREYYECHDALEELWNDSEEPVRTLVHGILQCAVGLHHLFNQNHKGAMMELGEGVCKLRKLNFNNNNGAFQLFEQEVSAVLEFLYQTQLELAACTDEVCETMDGSERSYELLGGYAAGHHVYSLLIDDDNNNNLYISFSPQKFSHTATQRIKLPQLHASQHHFIDEFH